MLVEYKAPSFRHGAVSQTGMNDVYPADGAIDLQNDASRADATGATDTFDPA
jgi:hypothetical protein